MSRTLLEASLAEELAEAQKEIERLESRLREVNSALGDLGGTDGNLADRVYTALEAAYDAGLEGDWRRIPGKDPPEPDPELYGPPSGF